VLDAHEFLKSYEGGVTQMLEGAGSRRTSVERDTKA
jgi:hypothetical protein